MLEASSGRLPIEGLSCPELAVVELLCEGYEDSEIAERLHRSRWTIKSHIARACEKLGARNRTHVATKALREGLVS